MNRKRRSKSSEEVTIEIRDSEKRSKKYWNLRENKDYSYNHKRQKDLEKHEGPRDEIRIGFNLDENRKLSEQQKQVILNTLIEENEEARDRDESRHSFSRGLIPLLILFTLLAMIISLIALTSSC